MTRLRLSSAPGARGKSCQSTKMDTKELIESRHERIVNGQMIKGASTMTINERMRRGIQTGTREHSSADRQPQKQHSPGYTWYFHIFDSNLLVSISCTRTTLHHFMPPFNREHNVTCRDFLGLFGSLSFQRLVRNFCKRPLLTRHGRDGHHCDGTVCETDVRWGPCS